MGICGSKDDPSVTLQSPTGHEKLPTKLEGKAPAVTNLSDRPDQLAPLFALNSRGKKSVALDLKDGAGRAALERLLSTADVFLSNLREAALERLDLGCSQLRERFPKLVIARVTGYGRYGDSADLAAYALFLAHAPHSTSMSARARSIYRFVLCVSLVASATISRLPLLPTRTCLLALPLDSWALTERERSKRGEPQPR